MARFRRKPFRRGGLKRKRRFSKRGGRKFNKRVKFAINKFAERKYLDYAYNGTAPAASVIVYSNLGIAQGSSAAGQRIGNEIYNRSLKIRLHCTSTNSGDSGPIHWRIVIGCWKDYTVSAPSMGTVLQDTSYWDISPLYRTYLLQKKWIPMWDKTFMTSVSGGKIEGNMNTDRYFNLKFIGKRLPMKRAMYNSSNNPQNAYFVLVMTDAVTISYPSWSIYSRLTYTDV